MSFYTSPICRVCGISVGHNACIELQEWALTILVVDVLFRARENDSRDSIVTLVDRVITGINSTLRHGLLVAFVGRHFRNKDTPINLMANTV